MRSSPSTRDPADHVKDRRAHPFLDRCRAVTINRIEAQALVPTVAARMQGQGRRLRAGVQSELPWLMRTGLSFGGFDMGLGEFLRGLMAVSRAQRIAITDGAQGAYLANSAGVILSDSQGQGPRAPPAPASEMYSLSDFSDVLMR